MICTTSCSTGQEGAVAEGPLNASEIDRAKLKEVITSSKKPYVLVNFYATWCKPCRLELPDLVQFEQAADSKVKLVLISLDNAEVIESNLAGFLQEYQIDFHSFFKSTGANEFVRSLNPEWGGMIPLNLLYDNKGNLIEAMGITDRSEVEMIVNRNDRNKSM